MTIHSTDTFELVRNKIQVLSSQFKVDLITKIWQHRDISAGLIIMDMDSTLVQAETIDEIARLAGVGDKVAKITESAMRGELDFTESLNARVAMLKGISVDELEGVHSCLPLTMGAAELLNNASLHGCHTALVSGGFTRFAEPITKKLAINTLSANVLEIKDGFLTGQVIGEIVDARSKLDTLRSLQSQLKLHSEEIIAIGDGANDLLMLGAAGTGIAFHAKPKVQQQASAHINYNNLNAVNWLLNW